MNYCQTNWGSHGCFREDNHRGKCHCVCCNCIVHFIQRFFNGCVGRYPYYGKDTKFY